MRWLAKVLNRSSVFQRNQGFPKKKVKAFLLYMAGLGHDEITRVLHAVKRDTVKIRLGAVGGGRRKTQ